MNFPSSTGMRISAMATAGLGALVAYLMLAQHTEVKRMREERAALARDNEALRAELSRKTSAAGAGAARAASTGTGGIGRVSADAEPVVGARDTAGAPAGVGGGRGNG